MSRVSRLILYLQVMYLHHKCKPHELRLHSALCFLACSRPIGNPTLFVQRHHHLRHSVAIVSAGHRLTPRRPASFIADTIASGKWYMSQANVEPVLIISSAEARAPILAYSFVKFISVGKIDFSNHS